MEEPRSYHHGDLRATLIRAARDAVATEGPEALSLRGLAEATGVSRAAPYRHFHDRRALLAEVAAQGFTELTQAYANAATAGPTPAAALREAARAYLGLAFGQPGLFRLMFDSDIVGPDAPISLTAPAAAAWEGLYRAVAAVDPGADEASIKRRAITGWSTLHGFVALIQGGRLKGFMTEPLTEAELFEAIVEKTLQS